MPKYAVHKDTQSLRVSPLKNQRVMVQKYDYEHDDKVVVRYLTTIMEWDKEQQIYVATHQTDTDYVTWEDNTYHSKKDKQKCICGVEY